MGFVYQDNTKKVPYVHQEYPSWVHFKDGRKSVLVETEAEHRELDPDAFTLKALVKKEPAADQLMRLDTFLKEAGLADENKSPVDCAIELMRMAMETKPDVANGIAAGSGVATDPEIRRGPGRPPKAN